MHMSFVELGAVTVALFGSYCFASVLEGISKAGDMDLKDPRPLFRRAWYVFVLVEIGAHDVAVGVLTGVL